MPKKGGPETLNKSNMNWKQICIVIETHICLKLSFAFVFEFRDVPFWDSLQNVHYANIARIIIDLTCKRSKSCWIFCRSSAFSIDWTFTLRVCFSETWICGCLLSGSSTPAWLQKWWVPHFTPLYRHSWEKNSCPSFYLWLWSVSNIPTMSQISSCSFKTNWRTTAHTLMIIFRPMETAPAMESLAAVNQIFLNTPCPSVSSWLWSQDIWRKQV